jgi:hypothetical protein
MFLKDGTYFKKYGAKIHLPGNGILLLFIPQSSSEFWHGLPLVIFITKYKCSNS